MDNETVDKFTDEIYKTGYVFKLLGIQFYNDGIIEDGRLVVKFSVPKEVHSIFPDESGSKFIDFNTDELISYVKDFYKKKTGLTDIKFLCKYRDDIWTTEKSLEVLNRE